MLVRDVRTRLQQAPVAVELLLVSHARELGLVVRRDGRVRGSLLLGVCVHLGLRRCLGRRALVVERSQGETRR